MVIKDKKEQELEDKVLKQLNYLMAVMDYRNNDPDTFENEVQRQLGVLYYLWKELTTYQEETRNMIGKSWEE